MKWARRLRPVMSMPYRVVADAIRGGEIPDEEAIRKIHQGSSVDNLRKLYGDVMPQHAKLGIQSIQRKHLEGFEFKLGFEQELIEEWIASYGFNQAQLISKTTIDEIREIILQGQVEGLPENDIARNIQKKGNASGLRATMIARTEVHNAAMFASRTAVEQTSQALGLQMLKRWLRIEDESTRPDHAAMDNHPAIPINEKFTVGGERMDRPGDPSASAAQVINCRCVLIYEEA